MINNHSTKTKILTFVTIQPFIHSFPKTSVIADVFQSSGTYSKLIASKFYSYVANLIFIAIIFYICSCLQIIQLALTICLRKNSVQNKTERKIYLYDQQPFNKIIINTYLYIYNLQPTTQHCKNLTNIMHAMFLSLCSYLGGCR